MTHTLYFWHVQSVIVRQEHVTMSLLHMQSIPKMFWNIVFMGSSVNGSNDLNSGKSVSPRFPPQYIPSSILGKNVGLDDWLDLTCRTHLEIEYITTTFAHDKNSSWKPLFLKNAHDAPSRFLLLSCMVVDIHVCRITAIKLDCLLTDLFRHWHAV